MEADEEGAVDVAGGQVVGRPMRLAADDGMSRTSCRSRAASDALMPRRSRGKNGSVNRRPLGSAMTTAIESLRRVTRLRAARLGT